MKDEGSSPGTLLCEVVSLPTKPQGPPLLLGKELDSLEVKEQL